MNLAPFKQQLGKIPTLPFMALRTLRDQGPRLFRIPGIGLVGWDPRGDASNTILFHTKLVADIYDRREDPLTQRPTRAWRHLDRLVLGSGLVTTAGVNLLAADWTNGSATLKLANNHDSGTGTTAAAIGDTALQTPIVNTTSSTTVATGSHAITIASGTNTVNGQVLGIDVGSGVYEAATITAGGGTTSITLTFANAHTASYAVIAVRQAGTQTNPISGQYQTVATISYYAALAITEWGLWTDISRFGGAGQAMWDHKVFSALNVTSTTSIQFTYQLTCTAGG